MEHEKTRDVLNEWKIHRELPVDFDSTVWRRIERAGSAHASASRLISDLMSRLFARPAVAFSYTMLALIAGLTVGQVQASRHLEKREAQLKIRYLQSIDPYAKPLSR
jgi:hypothetical protein